MAKSDKTPEVKPPRGKKGWKSARRISRTQTGRRALDDRRDRSVRGRRGTRAPGACSRPEAFRIDCGLFSASELFLWLLILAGFVSAWLVNRQWLSPEVAGWIYVWVLVYFI